MSFWKKITRSNFAIRLRNWEYWPFGIVQFPVFFYWLWLSIRARSLFFFSASNPTIPTGGMMGESKFDILEKIPASYKPIATRISLPATLDKIKQQMTNSGLSFPVIFKPDMGERGWRVMRINHDEDVLMYLRDSKIDFIIQDFVNLPLEFGIFYRRFPTKENGIVISVVTKEMLHVIGNGKDSLHELILQNDRAKLQWDKLYPIFKHVLFRVPSPGEKVELVSIGNHARGAKFMNGQYLINERLSRTFDQLSKQIDGFYFGRFDLRTASLDDLYDGKFMIMELNGCGAEPAHIYQPGFPFWKAVGVMIQHWTDLFKISIENHKRGIKYMTLREGIGAFRKFKAIMKE